MYVWARSLLHIQCLHHKIIKKVCVSLGHFGHIFDNIKQVVRGRCCSFPPHVFWDAIHHIFDLVNDIELYLAWWGVVYGNPEVLVDLTPCDGHFSIFPYCVSMSAITLKTISESTCKIFRLSTCQSIFHCLPLKIMFITHQSYFFLW